MVFLKFVNQKMSMVKWKLSVMGLFLYNASLFSLNKS